MLIKDRHLENIPIILDSLKIEYNQTSGRYFFPCPIHNSSRYNSLSLYENTGKWRCFSKHCEQDCGESFYDLLKTILKCTKKEVVAYCDRVLEGIESNIQLPSKKTPKVIFNPFPRKDILEHVNPEIPFYLRMGYSKETLEKYDLFICNNPKNKFFGRIIVPVYDDNREYVVGFLGRTLCDKCNKCEYFHSKNSSCPQDAIDYIRYSKWRNAKGFSRNNSLFNFWFSKESIKEKKSVVIVESPGNAMKLAQAGIDNSVALFGTEITKKQIEKISESGAIKAYLGLDNDDAGKLACERITKKLKNIECIPFIPALNDFGEMSDKEIIDFANLYF